VLAFELSEPKSDDLAAPGPASTVLSHVATCEQPDQ
jgi:hypothetical protein